MAYNIIFKLADFMDTPKIINFYFYSDILYDPGMPRKARIDVPGALHHIIVRGIGRRKIFKDDTDRINFLDRVGKVLSETGRNISAWKATDKSQRKKPFLLLGGQGIGTNNGGSCPKANYLTAGCQYECSAWRANRIRKWILTNG